MRALLLQALYSVRSERQLMEQAAAQHWRPGRAETVMVGADKGYQHEEFVQGSRARKAVHCAQKRTHYNE